METELHDLVAIINSLVRQQQWFNFHVLSYDRLGLTVAGGTDLIYCHTLEIIFEDVFFVSGFFNGWRSDTSATVFYTPDNERELNEQLEIEQGYQLFIFRTEDYRSNFIVAARKLSYSTDTVYYYDRDDLKENERIANFVKSKRSI